VRTRAGKAVYPDGPGGSKYPRGDCRHIASGFSGSRSGGYIKQNLNVPARAQRRREEMHPSEQQRVRMKVARTAMKNRAERIRRKTHARRRRST
jgi:hypothetical protein